jgi:hypothetical protein
MGKCRYNSTNSLTIYGVGGEVHTVVALPLRKELTVPIEQEAG